MVKSSTEKAGEASGTELINYAPMRTAVARAVRFRLEKASAGCAPERPWTPRYSSVMIIHVVRSLARQLGAAAVCVLTLACGRVGVSLLPEHEPDLRDPDPEPDAEPEVLDAAPAADADLEIAPDSLVEEQPPTPVEDAGSPLDAAMSTDAGSAMDAAAIPDAAPDAAPTPDASTTDGGRPHDAASSTDSGADAAAGDASTDAAAPDASAPDASLPECTGALVRDLCWYFGPLNNSCLEVCSSHGGYDSRMVGVVGTRSQGGTVEACNDVLRALGESGTATPANRSDDKGYGCHEWGGDLWWISSAPDFRPDVAGSSARVACACLR
jgi:hypothetical protein